MAPLWQREASRPRPPARPAPRAGELRSMADLHGIIASLVPPTMSASPPDVIEIIAETGACGHAAGWVLTLTRNAPVTKIAESTAVWPGAPRANHRLAFPLVAEVNFRQALQARGFPQIQGQPARRLRLHAPGGQWSALEFMGRVVRSRQAARIHGQPRPRGRRGLLDRSVLGRLLRHAACRRARLRADVERGDGRRAEEISGPSLGECGRAAAGHAR